MTWYTMPTGLAARRSAAIEQALAHLDAAECALALAGCVGPECRTALLATLRKQLDCAATAMRVVQRAGAGRSGQVV